MLATIPISKTSASRMTPELRDTAAFGAVFSDHMLVAISSAARGASRASFPTGRSH